MKKILSLIIIGSVISLYGCGGSGSSSNTDPSTVSAKITLTGAVVKGPVASASVTIYQINSNGSRGSTVAGPFSTANDGSWSGELPAGSTGPFEVVATGGSYTDEATGETVTLQTGDELQSLIPEGVTGSVTAAITPYTHALALSMREEIKQGKTPAQAVTNAINSALSGVGFDVTQVIPPDPRNLPANATEQQKQYAALLGGISQLGQNSTITSGSTGAASRFQIALAITQDMGDGKLDGKGIDGNPISVTTPSGAVTLPPLDASGTSLLTTATNTFTSAQGTSYNGVTVPAIKNIGVIPKDTTTTTTTYDFGTTPGLPMLNKSSEIVSS